MAVDIFNVDKVIANVVNSYVVRPTGNTNNTSGINGFVFDIVGEEEAHVESDVTDHYVEENFAIQDHVALRPLRFTMRGYVGELTDIFPNTFIGILTKIQSLQSIGGFFPEFTAQATQVYAQTAAVVSKVGEVVNQAKNVYGLIFGASTTATKQQLAYTTLMQTWVSRQLCSVETPWGVLNNMIIESMRILQRDSSNMVTDFEVSFKQLNVVSTVTIPSLASINPAGTGSIPASSPIILAGGLPNQPVPPSQLGTLNAPINSTPGNSVSGRLDTMLPPPVSLGNTIGVVPPPNVGLPTIMPPVYAPLGVL